MQTYVDTLSNGKYLIENTIGPILIFQVQVRVPRFKKYAPVKPGNYSQDCKIDPQCSEGCDVCCNLPYNVKTGQIKVHQSLAEKHEFWLADKRLKGVIIEQG